MKSGIREIGVVLANRMLSLLIGIGIQSSLAWLLAPEGRGAYAVCLIFASVLGVLCGFGMDVAIQYHVTSKRITIHDGVSIAFLYVIIGSIISTTIGLGLIRSNIAFFRKADAVSFYIALIYVPIFMLTSFFPLLLIGLRKYHWILCISAIQSVLQLLSIMFLVWIAKLGVNGALISLLISSCVAIALNLVLIHREYKLKLSFPKLGHIYSTFLYGIRYLVARIANMVNFRIGTIILAFFVSKSEIGFFAVATQLMSYLIVISDTVNSVLFPRIATDNLGRPSLVAKMIRIVGGVVLLALIFLLAVGKPLVRVVFSPAFLPIVPLLWILAPGFLVRSVSKITIPYFNGTNRPGVTSVAVGIGVITNIVMLFVLLPKMGLEGAAWAMTIGYTVSSLILIASFHITSGLTVKDVWVYSKEDFLFLRSTFGV